MAEKTILLEGDINLDDAIADAQKMSAEVVTLKTKLTELKTENKQGSKEWIETSAQLKAAQGELRTQENLITKVTQAQRQNAGSIEQLRTKLAAVSIAWAKETKAQGENSEKAKQLAAKKLELTNALKKEEMATGDARRNVGNYQSALDGLPGPLGRATSSIKMMSKSLAALIANPVVLVITAIIGILAVLFKAFKSTDDGATELNARMEQMRVLFDKIRQRAVDLINEMKNLRDAIKDVNTELEETNPILAKTLEFIRRWANALATLGFSEFARLLKQQTQVIDEATEYAKKYIYALDALNDAEVNYTNVRAANLRQIAKLEAEAQDKTLDPKIRKKALDEAIRLSEQELEKTKEFADKRFNEELKYTAAKYGLKQQEIRDFIALDDEQATAAMKSNAALADFRNKLNDEGYKKLEELYSKSIEADTAFFREQKRNISKMASFEEEIRRDKESADKKALNKKKKASEDAVNLMQHELDKWKIANRDKLKNLQAELVDKEKEILRKRLDEKLITQQDYDLKILQLESDLQVALKEKRKEFQEKTKQDRIEALETNYQNELSIAGENMFAQIALERQMLETRRQQEVENAKKIGADVSLINKKYKKAELALEQAVVDTKLSIAGSFAGNLASLLGESTALGKAAAIAETTINTYKAAQAAYAAMAGIPPAPLWGVAAAATATAAGLANVKKILQVKSGLPGESTSASGVSSISTVSTSASQVARSTVNPEIGQGIVSRYTGESSTVNVVNQPTLVIDDVTEKQSRELSQNETAIL